jgi:NAD(P)-dependent dehydrogenase (short-subunit alcohol dehydrogenase family)
VKQKSGALPATDQGQTLQREKQNEIEVLSSDQTSVEIAQMLERFRLDGKVAVITGGGNGIGRATAAALAEADAAVAPLDRDEKAVKETETSLRAAGAEVEAYILDVTDEIALETSFAGVNRRWWRLDILVNNAGISIRHSTVELSLADWNNVVAVNMTGVFLGSRAAARYMLPREKEALLIPHRSWDFRAVASIQTSLIKQQKGASSI